MSIDQTFKDKIVPELMKEFNYSNIMQVPKLEKITLSACIGECIANKKLLDLAINEITSIAGQKPVKTKAKKSISNFKLRQDMEIGCKVTLRKKRMWEFLERFINVALPRIKDFRGLNDNSFDGRGNYSVGIKEQVIFPEIDYDKVEKISGFNICINTSAKTDKEAYSLLKRLGIPFIKR